MTIKTTFPHLLPPWYGGPGDSLASGATRHSQSTWLEIARERWEIVTALTVMVSVLAILDVVALGKPELILASAPVLFLLATALIPLSRRLLLGWIAACLLLAVAMGDARLAGLCYPAPLLAGIIWMRRRLGA